MNRFVDREVLDEPLVLRLANRNVAANASQVTDEDIFAFLDENIPPEELDERITKEQGSQIVVVFFEYQEQRTLLHALVCRLLDTAREEDNQHLIDAILVKEILGRLHMLNKKFGDLLSEVGDCPMLEPLHIIMEFKRLAEERSESSQDWLVECIDLD